MFFGKKEKKEERPINPQSVGKGLLAGFVCVTAYRVYKAKSLSAASSRAFGQQVGFYHKTLYSQLTHPVAHSTFPAISALAFQPPREHSLLFNFSRNKMLSIDDELKTESWPKGPEHFFNLILGTGELAVLSGDLVLLRSTVDKEDDTLLRGARATYVREGFFEGEELSLIQRPSWALGGEASESKVLEQKKDAELLINPRGFILLSQEATLSDLLHELIHYYALESAQIPDQQMLDFHLIVKKDLEQYRSENWIFESPVDDSVDRLKKLIVDPRYNLDEEDDRATALRHAHEALAMIPEAAVRFGEEYIRGIFPKSYPIIEKMIAEHKPCQYAKIEITEVPDDKESPQSR